MNNELFFKEEVSKMAFMGIYDVNFVAYLPSVVAINDPFFKKSNVLAPFFGDGRSVHKTREHSYRTFSIL